MSNGLYDPPKAPKPLVPPEVTEELTMWSDRLANGKKDRKRYEPTWDLCKSFVAGRQWVGIHPRTGRVIADVNFKNREKHTVNLTSQYVQTVLGKLAVEDLRPALLFTREDTEAESITSHARNLARYCWDVEVNADRKIDSLLHKKLAYGTAALRCMFDTSQGDPIGDIPLDPDGNPIVDPQQARAYVASAQSQGEQVPFRTLKSGKIVWDVLGPRQLVPPPGIEDPDNFPWLIVQLAMPVEWIPARFPNAQGEVDAEELTTTDSLDSREMPTDDDTTPFGGSGKLKEHAIISYGYELPTDEHPNGRTVVWNEKSMVLLDVKDSLPYKLRGQPHHGIIFFHYHRVPDRFWGMGVVEGLIGPQRQLNRARSQMIDLKDRNLGRVYARKGTISISNAPKGKIMELIEIPLHADYPQETAGGGVGPWISNEAEINKDDLNRVAGLSDVSVSGQVPQGLAAYASLALVSEQDERRVGPVLKQLRLGIADTMLLTLELARKYFQDGKHLAIAGPSKTVDVFNFERAQLPTEFYLDVAASSPLPTTPAAESQKIFDIWNAMIAGGQPLPGDWLVDSLAQGKALPIPKREDQVQKAKAEQENVMIYEGMMVVPAYYDDDFVHVTAHREAQVEWGGVPGKEQFVAAIEQHIQMHLQNAQMKKPTSGGAGSVPNLQGAHGVEAQNGSIANQQGLAQSASGTAPIQMPGRAAGNG